MSAADRDANLVALFERTARLRAEHPFLWRKSEGVYRPWSWRRTAEEVRALARALRARGLAPGDRVLLVAENRPEWLIADLAIMAAGGITVPAYTTNTTREHAYLLEHSGATAAVVAGDKLAAQLLPATAEAPALRFMISVDPLTAPGMAAVPVLDWRAALAEGEQQPDLTPDPATALSRQDTACFIYTSGTGGLPKGVMLSHGSILSNVSGCHAALALLGLDEHEVFLSFLPLSHAYEHTAGQFLPIAVGAQIYYADGLEALTSNLLEARPTVMACVPRLYEMMRQRILNTVARQGGLKAKLFGKTVEIGSKRYRDPQSLALAERLLDPVLERLVREQVRARFGGRIKALVSGGAPLNYEVGLFFTALGLPVFQGYGQTECAPVASVNTPLHVKLHSVGPPLPGIEVKIAGDGEILLRGDVGHAGLLARSGGDRGSPPGRLAAHRRHRRARRRRLSADHRSQEGHHRQFRRRQSRAAARGGRAAAAARDRPGDRLRRPPSASGRPDRPRRRFRRELRARSIGCRPTCRAGRAERLPARNRGGGRGAPTPASRCSSGCATSASSPSRSRIENGPMTPTLKLKRQVIYRTHGSCSRVCTRRATDPGEDRMRTLMLMRHAKSSWDEPALGDEERPLAPRGRLAAPLVARHMQERGRPDLVLCSPAVRVRRPGS